MTELQKEMLDYYLPEYKDIKDRLEQYSDYELNLVYYNLPDSIDDLQNSICSEIQWNIIGDLCGPFINNWDDFYSQYEGEIIDYCWSVDSFIHYNDYNHSYEISKETIKDVCSELISIVEDEEDYTLSKKVDFSKVIAYLNSHYPVKFCEV